jgi:hypothetical protein
MNQIFIEINQAFKGPATARNEQSASLPVPVLLRNARHESMLKVSCCGRGAVFLRGQSFPLAARSLARKNFVLQPLKLSNLNWLLNKKK